MNDRVYLTNKSYIGYYKNFSVTAVPAPTTNYKLPLPAGQRIEYYRGRLYVAKGNVIYIADALCDHYDIRTGFRVFENDITMLRAVDNGIYVSDGNTWFLQGAEPDEFQRTKVSDSDAIPYTDSIISGLYVGSGIAGNMAIWTSTYGICIGDNTGVVKNLTSDRYYMSSGTSGYGMGDCAVRNKNGQVHYITSLE
jgi:hypothetical protein